MAKEKFERTKPHVNVGTIGHTQTVEDTSGQLAVEDLGSETTGNEAPSSQLIFNAPASSVPETAVVAFPIDDTFVFDPAISGAATSIDYEFDVAVNSLMGDTQLDVALAIIQDGNTFLSLRTAESPTIEVRDPRWTTRAQSGLTDQDFRQVGGDTARVDFSQPFQFGYAFTAEYSSTALNADLGLDNMGVTITTIPEPTSVLLAFAMGATLLWKRWRDGDDTPSA